MTATSPNRSRRAYRSPRRQQQAAETRAAVLAAAADLFSGRGWTATGMRDVAAQAGVSVETVYANFRSKAELLMAAVDVAVVGDVEPVPLAQRAQFARLSVGSFADRVASAARLVTEINDRIAGLHRAFGEAASSDPELAQKMADAENSRRRNVQQAAEMITGRPIDDRERDGVWAVMSTEVYRLLTAIAGWSNRRYEEWLTDTLSKLLGGQEG